MSWSNLFLRYHLTMPPKLRKMLISKHHDDAVNVGCLMLVTMDSKLQKQHEYMGAYDMIVHLKQLYQEQARHERFEISKALFSGKPKAKVADDDYCFHYGNTGHWKRNCKVYLEELKKKKGNTSVYNVETKRFKSNDSNSTYLWHCRLGHISESRISRLHKNGLLDSFDLESIETYEPCLMGKMTKAPFTGKGE
ncbi:hypothetical protein CRG98_033391 [Punica granatum]|uniref:GAG-pre-integrase domain-containing protein n=1 Tax=Punica granatum TaxID=22663 RepID=A0A2I0IQE4_PUNGR|nr:hypothetical protein CRG98_033391 [Punica granatum]